MGEKFRNVVCEPKDVIDDIKRQILELISLNNTTCNTTCNTTDSKTDTDNILFSIL